MFQRTLFFLFVIVLFTACDTTRNPNDGGDTPRRSSVQEITDDNFTQKMKEGEGLRMVYFWATWCGPCRILGPTVENVSDTYKNRVLVGKMDVDAHFADAFKRLVIRKDAKLRARKATSKASDGPENAVSFQV